MILFLDDDGRLTRTELLADARERFRLEDDLAIIALRIIDETGSTARRHLSGLRHRPDDKHNVTSFPGGGVIVRRDVFLELGGLCDAFTYALEETDLAWRIIDHGYQISYDPTLTMFHPRSQPSRHLDFARITARNRVWLAHRRLPAALALIYPFNWLLVSIIRNLRSPSSVRASISGTLQALRTCPGPRQPIRWATVWRLTRLGRPPII